MVICVFFSGVFFPLDIPIPTAFCCGPLWSSGRHRDVKKQDFNNASVNDWVKRDVNPKQFRWTNKILRWLLMGVSMAMVLPKNTDGLFHGQPQSKMDDWGVESSRAVSNSGSSQIYTPPKTIRLGLTKFGHTREYTTWYIPIYPLVLDVIQVILSQKYQFISTLIIGIYHDPFIANTKFYSA